MASYYNEIDPFAAAWLRELIKAGLIAPGEVDERDIRDVRPDDLRGFVQCHFFAGIGVWSYALRNAGWSDDRPVWTGSCPCQPFSAAGKRGGTSDERHLWPAFYELIRSCQPRVVFGEQVGSWQVVGKQGKGSKISGSVPPAASRQGFDPARKGACGEAEPEFRLGPMGGADPSADRRWHLRSDGPAIQADRWPDLGQPVNRSSATGAGLFVSEHSRGLPRSEQRDGRLGGAEAGRDGGWNSEETESRIRRIIEEIGRTPDGEDEPAWLDVVFSDLERAGYACGSAVLAACGVGAPHIRQRLWFVGEALDDAAGARHVAARQWAEGEARDEAWPRGFERGCSTGELADAAEFGWFGRRTGEARVEPETVKRPDGLRAIDGVADADDARSQGWIGGRDGTGERAARARGVELQEQPGPTNSFWRSADWLYCRDDKWRPVEPGTFPLAHGAPARVGRLRGYGNAIVAEAARTFIEAYLDARHRQPVRLMSEMTFDIEGLF